MFSLNIKKFTHRLMFQGPDFEGYFIPIKYPRLKLLCENYDVGLVVGRDSLYCILF